MKYSFLFITTLKILTASQSHEPFSDSEDTPLLPKVGKEPLGKNTPQRISQKTTQEVEETPQTSLIRLIQEAFDEGDASFAKVQGYLSQNRWNHIPFMKQEMKRLSEMYKPQDLEVFIKTLPEMLSIHERRSLVAIQACAFN